jgi:predicted HTH transcriptional regulator
VNLSEAFRTDAHQLKELRYYVAQGEGLHLEFKRKASHPDKVVKEIISFANTAGGTLLIGVDDDRSIPGVKYPEEEWHEVQKALTVYCRPVLSIQQSIIPLSEKKFVLRLEIQASTKRPHYFKLRNQPPQAYVRHQDKCLKASREMTEIIRRSKQKRDIRFHYGEAEKVLMEQLAVQPIITLPQFMKAARITMFQASRKLILLVLANVLKITPTEKGDLYSRV